MNNTQNTSPAELFARRITLHRARYLSSLRTALGTDYDALEAWEDASAGYYNATGTDHPMARYAPEEH